MELPIWYRKVIIYGKTSSTFVSQLKEISSRIGIKEFYNTGKDILVTGATGFMGKVLVEKLLRSILDIGNVYILVRGKRGKTTKERLDDPRWV